MYSSPDTVPGLRMTVANETDEGTGQAVNEQRRPFLRVTSEATVQE